MSKQRCLQYIGGLAIVIKKNVYDCTTGKLIGYVVRMTEYVHTARILNNILKMSKCFCVCQ